MTKEKIIVQTYEPLPQPELGVAILRARTDASVTLRALGERIGVSRQIIAYWEAGKRSPSVDRLLELAEALHVPKGTFLKEKQPTEEESRTALYAELRQVRLNKGMSQKELAIRSSLPVATVKAYETEGSGVIISEDAMRRICNALGVEFEASDCNDEAFYAEQFVDSLSRLNARGLHLALEYMTAMLDMPQYCQKGESINE